MPDDCLVCIFLIIAKGCDAKGCYSKMISDAKILNIIFEIRGLVFHFTRARIIIAYEPSYEVGKNNTRARISIIRALVFQ